MTRAKVGSAAMLEQFVPQEDVGYSADAEAAGFGGVMADEHFQPSDAADDLVSIGL